MTTDKQPILEPEPGNSCSDASLAKAFGQAGRAGLISIPTLNTHGYEVIPRAGISACAELLAAFLRPPL